MWSRAYVVLDIGRFMYDSLIYITSLLYNMELM